MTNPAVAGFDLLLHMAAELMVQPTFCPLCSRKIYCKFKMSARHWLIKFAPFRTSWAEIVARGGFTLRGVRSPEARKHLKAMKLGEPVFFYQSQVKQAILGLMQVSREAHPDPGSLDPQWVTCDFAPIASFATPLTLEMMRENESFADLILFKQPRLAVSPLTLFQSEVIAQIGFYSS